MSLKVQITNGVQSLKEGDTATEIKMLLIQGNGTIYDFTGKPATFVVSNRVGKLFERPVVSSDKIGEVIFSFLPGEITGSGELFLEIHIVDSSKIKIFPSSDYLVVSIDKNLNIIGQTITSYQYDQLRTDVAIDIGLDIEELNDNIDNIVNSVKNELKDEVIASAKISWNSPVANFAALSTTYPSAVNGETAMVRDTGKVYRFNGTSWIEIQDIDPTAINEVDTRLSGDITAVNTSVSKIVRVAPPSNGVDDTQLLRDFFDNGYTNVKLIGEYKVSLAEGTSLKVFTNTNGITIDGSECTFVDLRGNYSNNGAITPVFKFHNCKDIDVTFNFTGIPLTTPFTHLGYMGPTMLFVTGGSERIKFKGVLNHVRYGVLSGNYSDVSLGNCNDFKIDVSGTFIGYPIALYLVDKVKADITVSHTHRAAYLAGVSNGDLKVYFKNQYIADTSVLLTDAMTGTGTSKGCRNLDIYVEDTGSTIFEPTSVLAGISLSRVDPGTIYSDIKIYMRLKTSNTIATTMNGFRLSSGVKTIIPSYPFNWEPTIEIHNLTLSGMIDRSAQTASSGAERPIAIRGEDGTHYGTFSNFVFDNLKVIEMTGNTKTMLVQALGMTQGLTFRDSLFSNLAVELSTNVPITNITNTTIDRIKTANKLNIVGSTVKTVSVGDLTHTAANDILNSNVGGSSVETKLKFIDMTLSTSTTATAAIPSNALVLGITGIVTEAVTGVSNFNVGTSTLANEFGTAVAVGLGTSFRPNSMSNRDNLPRFYLTATDIIVAPFSGGPITGGKVRLAISYILFTAPSL